MGAKETIMKSTLLAAVAIIGVSFAVTSSSAMPLIPGVTSITPESQVIQVGQKHSWNNNWNNNGKKRRWHRHRHHNDNDFRFGFGFPLVFGLGYGLGTRYYNDDVDCIGRWHRHYSGRLHCHGQLVYD